LTRMTSAEYRDPQKRAAILRSGKQKTGLALLPRHKAGQMNKLEAVESVQIEIPLPPIQLSPNARFMSMHWSQRSKWRKQYRRSVGFAITAAKVAPVKMPVVIDADFYLCRAVGDESNYYPKDEDNARASIKSAQDALVDTGIIEKDSRKSVKVGQTRLHATKREHQGRRCVVLTIRTTE
jgi:hypothetical protein